MSNNAQYPKRCFETHPPLKIGNHLIYGGSCISPSVSDADIYIGFDMGMRYSLKGYPWNEGESVLFPIQDMGVPKDLEQFNLMIEWIAVQLAAQKKVHLGCIGGHGRTGLVLAALVKHMTGEVDAITYVRDNYCQKAVESTAQVEWLNKNFGITPVAGAKEYQGKHGGSTDRFNDRYGKTSVLTKSSIPVAENQPNRTREASNGGTTAFPSKHSMSIWGLTAKIKPVVT